MRDRGAAQSIVDLLTALDCLDTNIRDVQLLANSTQARVFIVDVTGRPGRVVVKLFKETRRGVAAALDDEFESLTLMTQAFRGVEVNGWPVIAPKLLFRSDSPAALVMTAVPGAPLDRIIHNLPPLVRCDLARRVSDALVSYWSSTGRIIADVTLSNILADTRERQLAFVDPGLPEPAFSCPGVLEDFAPGSRDLAFLLTNVLATNVRIGLKAPWRAQIRSAFAAEVVRHYAHQHLESAQLPAFLAELNSCANRHIDRIQLVGVRRPWRRFVRRRVENRLANILVELNQNVHSA